MRTFAILAAASGALAFLLVTSVPQPADAGWKRKAWRHGNVPRGTVYRGGPRWGYFPARRHACGRGCAYPSAYYPYWRTRYFRGWR